MGDSTDTLETRDETSRRERRRSRRKRRAVIFGVAVLVLLVWGGLAALSLTTARRDLLAATNLAEQGRDQAGRGELDDAQATLEASASRYGRGLDRLQDPTVRALSVVPLAGRHLKVVTGLASAGRTAAEAGALVTRAVRDLPGGPAALTPSGGRLPLDHIDALAEPLAEASRMLTDAAATVEATPSDVLATPVAVLRDEGAATIRRVAEQAVAGASLAAHLPELLGQDGPRRYFFGASTPAEQRGTGGMIGSYTILEIDDGDLNFGEFEAASAFPLRDPRRLEPPNADYTARYERWGAAGTLRNINMTPDFPSAATAIERLYEAVEGERLDGTIVADPFAFKALLEVTGPVRVAGVGRMTAENIVPYLTHDSYIAFGEENLQRKQVLGDVSVSVLEAFLSGDMTGSPSQTLRVLGGVAAGGHLQFHAADPQAQAALEAANLAGRLLDPPGDYLQVMTNNTAPSKIDFYEERRVDYDVELLEGGAVRAEVGVVLTNHAPSKNLPRYIIGPYQEDHGVRPGDSFPAVSVFGPSGSQLTSSTVDGTDRTMATEHELGHPVWTRTLRIPSGEHRNLDLGLVSPGVWTGTPADGAYRLTVQGQPTVRPTAFSLSVELPPGAVVRHVSPGLRVLGDRVAFEGTLRGRQTFEITFGNELSRALKARVRAFLGRPLFASMPL